MGKDYNQRPFYAEQAIRVIFRGWKSEGVSGEGVKFCLSGAKRRSREVGE